jgi:exopolysaccharide production protein ExoZ
MFWFIVVPFGVAVLVLSSSGLLTPAKFLLDLLLIPREGTLTLPAAWTLQHEVVFYALFGLLILNKWLGLVALTLWQLACLIVLVFDLLPQDYLLPATTYWGYYNFGFVFGIAIALLRDRVNLRSYPRTFASLGGLGFLGLLLCFIGEWRMGSAFFASPATASLIYFLLYSLVMLALLSMVNKPRPVLDTTLGSLGAASYVLYIVHEPLYSVLERIIRIPFLHALAAPTPTFISFVFVAVLTALALHFGVERPMLRRLRGRLLVRPGSIKAITKV